MSERLDQSLSCLQNFEMMNLIQHKCASFLATCLRQTVLIWVSKCYERASDVDGAIEQLRELIDTFPEIRDVEHYLTWVFFISAAAASADTLRNYFFNRLLYHVELFGWRNVPLMLEFLSNLWITGEAWPAQLLNHKDYICA